MASAPAKKRGVLPQFGTIVGGALDGWAFAFVRYAVHDGERKMILRCTPPNWPFADEVMFGKRDFKRLKAGQRAKRHDPRELVKTAMQAEKETT